VLGIEVEDVVMTTDPGVKVEVVVEAVVGGGGASVVAEQPATIPATPTSASTTRIDILCSRYGTATLAQDPRNR